MIAQSLNICDFVAQIWKWLRTLSDNISRFIDRIRINIFEFRVGKYQNIKTEDRSCVSVLCNRSKSSKTCQWWSIFGNFRVDIFESTALCQFFPSVANFKVTQNSFEHFYRLQNENRMKAQPVQCPKVLSPVSP